MLPPAPAQIGVFDQFVAHQPEQLLMKERILSLSRDTFDITLANGQPIFHVRGKVFSIADRKSVYDMAGNHLFDILREHLHIHPTWALHDPQGNKFFELKGRFKLIGSKASATFTTPATGKAESLTLSGNWLDTNANIVDDSTGAPVACINRKLMNGRQMLFGQQTYVLDVAPGVDMALMAALCICLDEYCNEKNVAASS